MHTGQAEAVRCFGLSLAALLVLMTVTKLASRLCAPLEAPYLPPSLLLLLLLHHHHNIVAVVVCCFWLCGCSVA